LKKGGKKGGIDVDGCKRKKGKHCLIRVRKKKTLDEKPSWPEYPSTEKERENL